MHEYRARVVLAWALVTGTAAAGCGRSSPRPPTSQRTSLDQGYCHATVLGRGVVEVEADYLPRVVTCENGAAGFEALMAQAVGWGIRRRARARLS